MIRHTEPVALIVIAKAPVAGRVKTRLCPPCAPEQAAALASAALRDTLAAVGATRAGRRVLAIDGIVPSWVPRDFEIIPQRGVGLAARLAAAFDDVGGPAVLVGMDTPQITPAHLRSAIDALTGDPSTGDRVDAVLGLADDGGYWTIGLRAPDARVFDAVPMSTPTTGRAQLERLRELGRQVRLLERLRDVDTYADAVAVAAAAPHSRFAAALAGVRRDAVLAQPA